MRPTIGRTIVFHDDERDYPAIVTKVHPEPGTGWVTLTVFKTYETLHGVQSRQGTGLGQWSWPVREPDTEPVPTRERAVRCRVCLANDTWEFSGVCLPCQDRGIA